MRIGQILPGLALTLLTLHLSAAADTSFHLVSESDTDTTAGSEVYLTSYNNLSDFKNHVIGSGGFTPAGIGSGFSIGGFAYDGSQFHVVMESDTDLPAGSEVYLTSYNSLSDFKNHNPAYVSLTPAGIGFGFSIGGFAFDGSQYHVVMESDTDLPAGSEVYLTSYNSLSDFKNHNPASVSLTQVGIGQGFSIGGFAYDGGQFHLVMESDTDMTGGSEVYLTSYNSLSDFKNHIVASSGATQVGIGNGFSIGGFAAVPEPSIVVLLLVGACLGFLIRRH